MATYEIWQNGQKFDEVWANGNEYTEAWALVDGVPTMVWAKGGGWIYPYFSTNNVNNSLCVAVDIEKRMALLPPYTAITMFYNINKNYIVIWMYSPTAKIYDLDYKLLGTVTYRLISSIPTFSLERTSEHEIVAVTDTSSTAVPIAYSFSNESGNFEVIKRTTEVNEGGGDDRISFNINKGMLIGRHIFDYDSEHLRYFVRRGVPRNLGYIDHMYITKVDDKDFLIDLGDYRQEPSSLFNSGGIWYLLNNNKFFDSNSGVPHLLDSDFKNYHEGTLPPNYDGIRCLYYSKEDSAYICVLRSTSQSYDILKTSDFDSYKMICNLPTSVTIDDHTVNYANVLYSGNYMDIIDKETHKTVIGKFGVLVDDTYIYFDNMFGDINANCGAFTTERATT